MTGRAVMRLLLLLLVSAGVAGMHTLGHATSSGHGGVAGHSAALVADEPMLAAASIAMEAVAAHTDAFGIGTRLHPLTVCLAILAGSLLLLLAAMLAAYTRRQTSAGCAGPAVAMAGRGPPLWTPLGLRLADLSVQRT